VEKKGKAERGTKLGTALKVFKLGREGGAGKRRARQNRWGMERGQTK